MRNKPIQPEEILAAICEFPFKGENQKTRRELRLSAVSQHLGRPVTSFKELAPSEIKTLITRWGHDKSLMQPSERGIVEIKRLAQEYATSRGQISMGL